MNDKPKGRLVPKQKIEITHFELDVPYSQGTKFLDRVQAINLSLADDHALAGKPLRMTIFNQAVKTFIRGKNHAVVDIEERDRPDNPEYGPDRTIVQAYDDEGKPVSTKQGGGGGYRGRSLEDDLALEAVKRRSIEGQTSVAQVGAFLAAGNEIAGETLGISPDDWNRIVGKYWKAVERGLDNYLDGPPPQPAKPPQDKPPASRQAAQDKQGKADKPAAVSEDQAPPSDPIKHVGDLLTRSSKLKPPVGGPDLCKAFSVLDVREITDLEAAWKKAQEISASKAAPPGGSEKLF